jgi:hypothetical protein
MSDERALVGTAMLVTLIATTVSAACVIYPDATARQGLLALLGAADSAASSVVVAVDLPPAIADDADSAVATGTADALGPAAGRLVRTIRSESWQLPGGTGLEHPPLTQFAWDEGLRERATLVAGAWPGAGLADEVEAVVTERAAAHLGITAGGSLVVSSRIDPGRVLTVRITGLIAITDPADPAWGGDPLVLAGAIQPGSFPLRGPLFVDRDTLLARTVLQRASLSWRALPSFERLGPGDIALVEGGLAGLRPRLEAQLGTDRRVTVQTDLPAILARAGGGITAGGSSAAIIAAQLLLLAMYALLLLAVLVVERRRVASELARARGARGSTLLGLATLEGLLIALPAVIVGPLLALVLVGILVGGAGGAAAAPRITPAALALALAAGLAAVAGVVLPAIAALGPVARLRGTLATRGSSGLAERTGIDVALFALAGLALWALRENGTPIVAAVGGGAAVDPLLAVAPAVGLLAGGLFALRVGPLIAAWLERPAGRAAGAVGSLAARGVARHSFQAGRAALLLVVATGVALFAVSYTRTWEQSQRDQVAAMLPADIVARVAGRPDAPSELSTRAAALRVDGITEAIPADRETFSVGNVVRQGVLVAVPAGPAAALTILHDDRPGTSLAGLVRGLAAGRPVLPLLVLPNGTSKVRLGVSVGLAAAPGPDGTTGTIPGGWTGLGSALIVQDGLGLLHRLAGAAGRITGGRQELDVPLAVGSGATIARPVPPVAVVAVELALTLPDGQGATGTVGLETIEVAGANGGAMTPLDLQPLRSGWGAVRATFGAVPVAMAADPARALEVSMSEPVVGPVPTVVAFRPSGLAGLVDATVPALVDRSTHEALAVDVGDVVPLQRGLSAILRTGVAGIVEVLPGIAPGAGGLWVDLPTMALVDYAHDGSITGATEWWLGASAADPGRAAAALRAQVPELLDPRVRMTEIGLRLDDPLALGARGALGLAAVAAVLFGVLGFAAAAWQATRSRRSELAVALALGLGRGQLAAWLGLELAFQLAVGIGGGIVVGLLLAWAVLPSVALTPDGSRPVPAAAVQVPWDLAALLALAGLAALAVALLPLSRLARAETLAAALREPGP